MAEDSQCRTIPSLGALVSGNHSSADHRGNDKRNGHLESSGLGEGWAVEPLVRYVR